MTGGVVASATPGGLATDLTIVATSLAALAGLLFVLYVAVVVAGVAWGSLRGPQRRGGGGGATRVAGPEGGR